MTHRLSLTGLVLLAAACVLAPAPLAAQGKGSLGIAVIDVQRIVRESLATKSMRPQLEKLKNQYSQELKSQENELRKADQDLTRQRAILSPEAYVQRRRELQRRAGAAQRSLQDRKRFIDQAISQTMEKVHVILRRIAVELAKEKQISLVIPKSSVFLVAKRYDITSIALERLNKRLPSVALALPKQK